MRIGNPKGRQADAPIDRLAIYFAGSIRGGRSDRDLYLKMIRHLGKFGDVLSEHVGHQCLSSAGEDDLSDEEIYRRDLDWLRRADLLVAEVTVPSLGVGYEIAMAEILEKPILCLYRIGSSARLSSMIAGNGRIQVRRYSHWNEARQRIDDFFSSLRPSAPD